MCMCSVDGCTRPVNAKGLCGTHYMQQRRAGLQPVGTKARGSLEERFWRFVKKSPGCWEWIGGSRSQKGYGLIGEGPRNGKTVLAHRLSYEMHFGQIPEGMVVMHMCDNPSCVNPMHLRVGTHSENTKDAVKKGRWKGIPPVLSGEKARSAKLTADDVVYIRTHLEIPTKELADKYAVDISVIQKVRKRITWKHID